MSPLLAIATALLATAASCAPAAIGEPGNDPPRTVTYRAMGDEAPLTITYRDATGSHTVTTDRPSWTRTVTLSGSDPSISARGAGTHVSCDIAADGEVYTADVRADGSPAECPDSRLTPYPD